MAKLYTIMAHFDAVRGRPPHLYYPAKQAIFSRFQITVTVHLNMHSSTCPEWLKGFEAQVKRS